MRYREKGPCKEEVRSAVTALSNCGENENAFCLKPNKMLALAGPPAFHSSHAVVYTLVHYIDQRCYYTAKEWHLSKDM